MTQPSILVTGANGFVGRALIGRGARDGLRLRAAARRGLSHWPAGVESVLTPDLAPGANWRPALEGADVVVHLAARVHVMHESSTDALAEFRRINVVGTLNLARQAVDEGVQRFVFISSVKVNGESTRRDRPFTPEDVPAPVGAYGVSKYEAEVGLMELAEKTGLEVVIVRPVLVYGPGVKGNFLSMMRWLHRRIPLPFGAVYNQRSLAALDNVVDFILTCISHPGAANQTFLISDGEDLSTTELIRRLARAMDRPTWLIPLPVSLLRSIATIVGMRATAERLLNSLQVDISKTRNLLNWAPPVMVDEGLRRTADHYLHDRNG